MMVRNAPESIWLNVTGLDDEDCDFGELAEVTWCEEPIDDCDVEYRRVRRHSPIRAEAARYRAALEAVLAWPHRMVMCASADTVWRRCLLCSQHMPLEKEVHADDCPYTIARRALHPEEGER